MDVKKIIFPNAPMFIISFALPGVAGSSYGTAAE